MNIEQQIENLAKNSALAAQKMAIATNTAKTTALHTIARLLDTHRKDIKNANEKDLAAAKKAGMSSSLQDRLRLTDNVINTMIAACKEIATLPDPIGEITELKKRPNGLLVGRMYIPLGVIAMIYEARPNVTVDSAILCLKAGNAVILRGGKEAFHSNSCLATLVHKALEKSSLPGEAIQLVPTTDRKAVQAMLKLDAYIDVIIPRGGKSLIQAVVAEATMPVLKHYMGVCHAYVDKEADLDKALEVVFNAKVQRPAACNALECLLVHKNIAKDFLPNVAEKLGKNNVKFKCCEKSLPLMGNTAVLAKPEHYGQEFHDLVLAVKTVDSQTEAQKHIARYGSHHTEIILTEDHTKAMRFLRETDASMVAINASSRFNDGGELGLGAEIGISTSKLHAYGPMGIKELTSTKFVVFGEGQVRCP